MYIYIYIYIYIATRAEIAVADWTCVGAPQGGVGSALRDVFVNPRRKLRLSSAHLCSGDLMV